MAAVTTMIVSGPLCVDAADTRLLGSVLFGEGLGAGRRRRACGSGSSATRSPKTSPRRCARPARRRSRRFARRPAARSARSPLEDLPASALAAVLIANTEGMGGVSPERLNRLEPRAEPAQPRLRQVPDAAAGGRGGQGGAGADADAPAPRGALRGGRRDRLADGPGRRPPLEAPLVELPSGTMTADQANVRGAGLANLTGIPAISVPVGLERGLAADRPAAAGGLGARRAAARRRRGARAGQRPALGRAALAARRSPARRRPEPDGGDRGPRAGARLRRRARRAGRRPRGRRGRNLRLPRPQRRRQDDDGAHADDAAPADRRQRHRRRATTSSRRRARCGARSASPSRRRRSTR